MRMLSSSFGQVINALPTPIEPERMMSSFSGEIIGQSNDVPRLRDYLTHS